jgi:ribosomal protein S18 acetylase RimI-like enzyme
MPHRLPVTWIDIQGHYLQLRPQRPDDLARLGALWNAGLSDAARFNRFSGQSQPLSPHQIEEQAALAGGQGWLITERLPSGERALAEGRWTPLGQRGEGLLALSVMTRCQRQGLGRLLLQALLRSAQRAGLQGLSLHALEANAALLRLAGRLGFEQLAAAPHRPWLRLHYAFQALHATEENSHV